MHLLAAFSLRNRSLIALVTIVAAFFGILAATSLKQELIPSVQFPQLAVISTYSGASPTVVSQQVSLPIEQAIRGIDGLQDTSSTSTTGSSTVSASFDYGTDLDAAEQRVGSAINNIRAGLPDGVDPTVVTGSLADFPVLEVAVTGSRTTDQLATSVNQSVIGELEKLDGVRAADLTGAPGQRITITPKQSTLDDHRISDSVIDSTLKASGVLVPAGSLTQNGVTRSVQVGTELGSTADIRDLPLSGVTVAQWNGKDIPTIGDVASVAEADDPVTTVSLVNGKPALAIDVTKLPSANTVEVSREVRAELPKLKSVLGAGGTYTIVFDQAPFVEESIQSLAEEGLLGLGFAIIVILLFLLSVRATIVTAISIPTSVLIALIGMQTATYSLNIITLGALTIAVGRVVDDSIVVIENIARRFRDAGSALAPGETLRPEDRVIAVSAAVREVAGAVTASTLTTVAVFVPIAFVGGTSGELFRPFALTVTIALLASLFVALTIVPVLAYWFMRPKARSVGTGGATAEAVAVPPRRPALQRGYRPILRTTLAHPWITILVAFLILVGTAFAGTRLQTNYLGSSGQNTLSVTQTLSDGTSLDAQTVRARQVDSTLRGIKGVDTVEASVGSSGNTLRDAFESGAGTQITYSVTTAAHADQDALQTTIRKRLRALPSVGEIQVASSQGFGTTSDIEVDITAGNAASLKSAANTVLAAVQKLSVISQASSNLSAAEHYLAVDIDAQKAAKAGYSEVALAQIVARHTQPTQLGSITIGDADLTIYLQESNDPKTVAALEALKIATPTGSVRLDSLASVHQASEAASITSADAKRSATVTATPADQDTGTASASVSSAVAKLRLPAGTSATLGGVTADQSSAFSQLLLALLAAILIVYTIMVATFRSLRQPVLLLVSVPFAATGAVLLQLISGIPLGVASIIGLVMLVGIVVTNAIVLIDLVNQYRRQGEGVRQAVLDGASRRLRPILMTALATIFALLPTGTGLVGSSSFISQPLALVVIGGLISSTVLTLIVLPTLYFLVEGRRERSAERRTRRQAEDLIQA